MVRFAKDCGRSRSIHKPQVGLLIALPSKQADNLVKALRAGGVKAATTVGFATGRQDAWVKLV